MARAWPRFSESTSACSGIRTLRVAALSVAPVRPGPSAPAISATRGGAGGIEHHRIDAEGPCRAGDRTDVLRIVRALEDDDPLRRGKERTLDGLVRQRAGGERTPVEIEADDLHDHAVGSPADNFRR